MAKSKPVTAPGKKAVQPAKKAVAQAERAIAPVAKIAKLAVPVFVNVKELRQWVKEQKKAQSSYDEAEVQRQLAQLLQVKVS